MGMFSGALETLGKGLEDVGEHLLQKTVASPTASILWSMAGVKQDMYKAFPEGAKAYELVKTFDFMQDKQLQALEKPRQAVVEGIKQQPKYMQQRLLEKPLGEIHQTLTQDQNPLAVHTNILLSARTNEAGESLNTQKTLAQLSGIHSLQAAAEARKIALGPNSSFLAPVMKSLLESENPVKNSYAHLLMDVISNDTRDLSSFRGAPISEVKNQIRSYVDLENRANGLLARAEGRAYKDTPLPNIKATYSKTTDLERAVRSFTIIRQAPFAAVSHALMPVNLVMSSPIKAIAKGLITMRTPELKQLYEATSILAQTMHSTLDATLAAGSSAVQHKTGNNRIASFIFNSFHMPGLNWIRKSQIQMAGAVGYHSAIMWGEAAAKGDKRAIVELANLGLNPQSIARAGGQLTDAELKQAVYHFAADRMFISRIGTMSLHANANPFMRSATTFHGFINAQSNFMQKTLLRMLKAGDYKGIAQAAATLGVAYPLVAPIIKSLGVLGRTASPDKALESASSDYQHLSEPQNFEEFAKTYIDLLSYVGGLGMAHSYIQGAWSDRLALTVMGPTFGAGIRTAQDAITGVTKSTRTGRHNLRPLGRDILDNTVPIIGKEAEHQLLPPERR